LVNPLPVEFPQKSGFIPRSFWLLIIIAVVAFIVSNGYFAYQAVKNGEENVSSLHLEIAQRAEEVIRHSLIQNQRAGERVSRELGLKATDPKSLLLSFMRDNPQFIRVSILDDSGLETMRNDRFTIITQSDLVDFGNRMEFIEAKKGEIYIGEIYFSERGEPMISITTPIYSPRRDFLGALYTELNLRFLWDLLGSISYGGSVKAYLVDQKGFLIADPDPSLVLRKENLLERLVVKKVLGGEKIVGGLNPENRYRNSLGEKVFTVGIRLEPYGWGIFTEEPLSSALVASRRTSVVGISLTLASIILLFILVYVIRRLIALNIKLHGLIRELDRGGKMLIRRDLELTRANEKLHELDQSKSNFISVTAHQLRTPLSGMKWTIDMVLSGTLGPLSIEQKSFLMKCYESNERMIILINDMLGADRIDSDKLKYRFVPTQIFDLLDNVLFEMISSVTKKKLQMSFVNKDRNLPQVHVDTEKMRAVLQNLLENAIKYTPVGGKIGIDFQVVDGFVQISIQDSGIGIPEEDKKNIFKRFFRAKNAIKMETDGSGLGLFIAKGIIEKHGGKIWFESKVGEGTIFHFTIPIVK